MGGLAAALQPEHLQRLLVAGWSGFLNLRAENFLDASGPGASAAVGTPGGEVMSGSRRALRTTRGRACPRARQIMRAEEPRRCGIVRPQSAPECWSALPVLGMVLVA
jgi:hypothetical protein